MITNKFSREILVNNFEILRKSKGLNKGDFNKLIDMANVYRPNYFSIGAKLLKGITDNYPGITKEWLLTPHDANFELPEIQKLKQADRRHGTYEDEPQNPYQHIKTVEIVDLKRKAEVVLLSNTTCSTALKNIIESYHAEITRQEDLSVANKVITMLREEISNLKKRLPAIGES